MATLTEGMYGGLRVPVLSGSPLDAGSLVVNTLFPDELKPGRYRFTACLVDPADILLLPRIEAVGDQTTIRNTAALAIADALRSRDLAQVRLWQSVLEEVMPAAIFTRS